VWTSLSASSRSVALGALFCNVLFVERDFTRSADLATKVDTVAGISGFVWGAIPVAEIEIDSAIRRSPRHTTTPISL
jgi:fructose-specific phosphotransferase system IIC component